MSDDTLRWQPAEEIGQRVRAGQLDPQSVVDAHLEAIERHDPRIHAYVYVDRAARGQRHHYGGVTLAVKDSQPVAGMPFSYETTSWAPRIAAGDALLAGQVRGNGG